MDTVSANASLRQQKGVPEALEIICGTTRGVLWLDKGKVVYEGGEVTPTEFEKIAGRAATKKWKQSLHLWLPNGREGGPVGNWLQDRDIQVGVCRPGALHTNLKTWSAGHRISLRSDSDPASPGIAAHVEKVNIGSLLRDPEAESLPSKMTNDWGTLPVIDTREVSEEQLLQLAADSAQDPLGALLQNPPGADSRRLAHFSGRESSHDDLGSETLDLIENGKSGSFPSEALDSAGPALVNGKELDLKSLRSKVQALGGFEKCCKDRLWPQIARDMLGCEAANSTSEEELRSHYKRLLSASKKSPGSRTPES